MNDIFTDEFFMKKALQEAEIAFEKGEIPVGAVIVIDNKVIARDIDVFQERPYANLHFFSGKGLELAKKIIEVSSKKLDIPSISKIRTMKDFTDDLKNLIYSLN